jgi:hypothetical protein
MAHHLHLPRHRVAPWVRWITATTVAYAAWMIAWISATSTWLEALLPVPWSVAGWLTTWGIIAALALTATITGRETWTRATLVALFAAEVAGIATAIAVPVAVRTQFFELGEAGLIIVTCGALLTSPLRPIPDPPPALR